MQKKEPFICIDFDGVLATYTGWKGEDHYGEPLRGAKEFLEKIKEAKLTFVVLTTRDVNKVKKWFEKYKFPRPIKITNTKIPSPVYIDDGALKFEGDFSKLLDDLKKFKQYWKSESTFKKYF